VVEGFSSFHLVETAMRCTSVEEEEETEPCISLQEPALAVVTYKDRREFREKTTNAKCVADIVITVRLIGAESTIEYNTLMGLIEACGALPRSVEEYAECINWAVITLAERCGVEARVWITTNCEGLGTREFTPDFYRSRILRLITNPPPLPPRTSKAS